MSRSCPHLASNQASTRWHLLLIRAGSQPPHNTQLQRRTHYGGTARLSRSRRAWYIRAEVRGALSRALPAGPPLAAVRRLTTGALHRRSGRSLHSYSAQHSPHQGTTASFRAIHGACEVEARAAIHHTLINPVVNSLSHNGKANEGAGACALSAYTAWLAVPVCLPGGRDAALLHARTYTHEWHRPAHPRATGCAHKERAQVGPQGPLRKLPIFGPTQRPSAVHGRVDGRQSRIPLQRAAGCTAGPRKAWVPDLLPASWPNACAAGDAVGLLGSRVYAGLRVRFVGTRRDSREAATEWMAPLSALGFSDHSTHGGVSGACTFPTKCGFTPARRTPPRTHVVQQDVAGRIPTPHRPAAWTRLCRMGGCGFMRMGVPADCPPFWAKRALRSNKWQDDMPLVGDGRRRRALTRAGHGSG